MTIQLTNISSGYSTGLINQNFQTLEQYINDNLLNKDGLSGGEANQLEVDLDVNSKVIYNLPEPTLASQAARLKDVQNAINGADTANLIEFTPYDFISATTVQGAIQEAVDFITPEERRFYHFDTISQLSSVTNPLTNQVVIVSGTEFKYDGSAWNPISPINIKAYGAVGDGVANDTSAVQSALNAASSNSISIVYVPYSEKGYIVDHGIQMPRLTTLKGAEEIFVPNLYTVNQTNDMTEFVRGHTFVITSTGANTSTELIRMSDGCTITGINFVHRDQVETNPPDPYPPVIKLLAAGGNGVNIRNCLMLNPYIGIDALGGHQNMNIVDVYMQPLRFGVRIDEATQVDRLTRLDIGGYWHRRNFFDVWDDPDHVVYYMQENAVGVEVGRADDFVFSDCLFYGVGKGIAFEGSLGQSYGKISNCAFDFNDYCIRSENGANSNGILVSNCTLIPSNKALNNETALYLDESTSGGNWEISNCGMWGSDAKVFLITLGGKVRVVNARINTFNKDDAAITVAGGDVMLTQVDWPGIGTGTGNYLSIPSTSSFVLVHGCTWSEGTGSTFEVFDPNNNLTLVNSYGY